MTKNHSPKSYAGLFYRFTGVVALILLMLAATQLFPGVKDAFAVGTFTATKSDALKNDVDSSLGVTPGDTLGYTISIQNTSGSIVTGAQFSDTIDSNTTLVPGSLRTTPVARNDSYQSIGNVGITVPDGANDLLANDNDPDSTGMVSVQSYDATSTNGGTVSVANNGSFTYMPPVGYEGTDTFTYTVKDVDDNLDSATVTITVSDVVWFIDNSAPIGGDGRLQSPFNSIATFNSTAVDDPGDIIFLFEKGGGDYNGGITLLNNQRLIGQGVDLVVNSTTLVTATTNPTLTSGGAGVTVAQNNVIRGLDIGNTGGSGLFAPATFVSLTVSDASILGQGRAINFNGGGVMDLSFDTLSSNGGPNGVIMTSVTGSLSAAQTVITNTTTGSAIWVSNSAAAFDFGNTSIVNSGLNGVELLTSSGSTFIFDSLSINISGNTGLLANNSGTITVLGSNNVINATGGTAVNLANTTIGTSGVTLQSVSASGTTNGITLNNTGNGAFTVTGSGVTDGSGGTIQNITQRGINLTNTQNVSLSNMTITNAATTSSASNCDNTTNSGCYAAVYLNGVNGIALSNVDISNSVQQGINGLNVANFSLTNSTVSNCGNGANDNCLWLTNLTGTSSITNSVLSFGTDRNALIQNNNAANLALTVAESSFQDTQSATTTGDTGLEVDFTGTSTGSVNVSGSSFLRNRTTAVQIFARDTAVVDVDLKGNIFNVGTGIGRGPEVGAEDSASMTFEISNNPTITARGGVAIAAVAINNANLQGKIENNSNINMNGDVGAAIYIKSADNATGIFAINNNTATIGTEGFGGIQVLTNEPAVPGGTATLDATISNNTIAMGSATFGRGIQLTDHSGNQLCANITGNLVNAGTGSPEVALNVNNQSSNPTKIQGYSTTLDAMWTANGNTTNIALSTNLVAGSVTSGTCATPTLPVALVAPATTAQDQPSQVEPLVMVEDIAESSKAPVTGVAGKVSLIPQVEQTTSVSATGLLRELADQLSAAGDALVASLIPRPAYASGETVNIDLRDLDPGQEITIIFDVTVDAPAQASDLFTQVCSQGTVSTASLGNTLTDDPDTGTASDPTCTPLQTGTIIIAKNQIPDGSTSFGFTSTIPGNTTFNLAGDSDKTIANLQAGSYTVTEDDLSASPFSLIGLTCNDSASKVASTTNVGTRTATVNLDAGETVTCTFANSNDSTVPYVVSVLRLDPSPTNAASVEFGVTFSEPVKNVSTGDFTLTTTGVTGTSVSTLSGSGATYTISADTGSGDGTIRLDVKDATDIQDLSGNPLSAGYTGGEEYKVVRSPVFGDVSPTYWAYSFIENMYFNGITSGCNSSPMLYCPNRYVTRAEMAIFLLRGIHGADYTPPAATGLVFDDVSGTFWAAGWIEQLKAEGITSGCGGGNYCPNRSVTRAEIAILLLRAKYTSSYTPDPATGVIFNDVSALIWAADWIEQLKAEGITSGCGGGNYCPNRSVTRAEMAIFLTRTFNLTMP